MAFFRPVLETVPQGVDAVALWDGIVRVAGAPGFSELVVKKPVRIAAAGRPSGAGQAS